MLNNIFFCLPIINKCAVNLCFYLEAREVWVCTDVSFICCKSETMKLCESSCVHVDICYKSRILHHLILNFCHLQLQNKPAHWSEMRLGKKNMLISLSGAATVKFAHSHAFFVSLTFHVEANSQPGAVFLPASFIQWGHTTQNPGNVKNGKVEKVSVEVCVIRWKMAGLAKRSKCDPLYDWSTGADPLF